jgi:hypothetical protein
MQITLSSTTSHTVNTLLDVPLPSRPPITAEKKSKKGKKGKGKDKAVEVAVEHGEWTIRKALEGDHAISIDDVKVSFFFPSAASTSIAQPNASRPLQVLSLGTRRYRRTKLYQSLPLWTIVHPIIIPSSTHSSL